MDADVVQRFYAAFDRRDGEAMAACYAPGAHFEDPVFGDLTGEEAGAMWRMLTRTARDLKVELAEHDARSAHWIARYTFSATGRPVVNDVRATFRIEDDLIVDHVDRFSFWKWSRQALGTKGLLLGWTPFLRGKVGGTARAGLDKFIAKESKRAAGA
jgi:ketosteroid isomerase-like protein